MMSLTTLEATDSGIVCRRSTGFRVSLGLLGGLFGALCLYLFYAFWPPLGALVDRSPADILSQSMYFLLVPLAGLCGPAAIFLYSAGPVDLVVNASQRTYRFRRGFPLLATWQSGSLEDVAGLRVKTVKNKQTTFYHLLLDWKNTKATPWTLGDGTVASRRPFQMMSSQDAGCVRDAAQRLASRLSIPFQENAPVWDEIRSRTIRRLILVPVFFFFLLMGLPPLIVTHSLEADGQPAMGTVKSLRTGKGSFVHYTYPVGGRIFTGHAPVTSSAYSSLEVGGPVPVRYLPAYPHTSIVVGARGADISGPALLMAGLILVMFVVSGRTPRS
jgi:hypothetical protein